MTGEDLLHMLPIGASNRFSSRDAKPNSMISDCTASRAACNREFDFATLKLQTCTMHGNWVHALMQLLNQSLLHGPRAAGLAILPKDQLYDAFVAAPVSIPITARGSQSKPGLRLQMVCSVATSHYTFSKVTKRTKNERNTRAIM